MNFTNIYFNTKYSQILTSRIFKNRMFVEQLTKSNYIFTEKGKTFFSTLWDGRGYNAISNRFYVQGLQFISFIISLFLIYFFGIMDYLNDLFEFVYWKSFDMIVFFS